MNKKIILLIIAILGSILISILTISILHYRSLIASDGAVDPIVFVQSGSTTIVRGTTAYDLSPGERFSLVTGDRVITRSLSLAVVSWPDQSVSRLGSDSSLLITEMAVTDDLSEVQISMDLEQGKIWTNVFRVLFGNSHFETRLPDQRVTAAVRGTIYEINLEKNYIHSVAHMIELTDARGKKFPLVTGVVVRADDIWRRLSSDVLDRGWGMINAIADRDYLSSQTKIVSDRLEQLQSPRGMIDRLARWILSHFSGYESLSSSLSVETADLDSLQTLSPSELKRWYSAIANSSLSLEMKDRLRKAIERTTQSNDTQTRLALWYGSLWDRMSLSGSTVDVQKSLEDSIQELSKGFPDSSREWRDALSREIDVMKSELEGLDTGLSRTIRKQFQQE